MWWTNETEKKKQELKNKTNQNELIWKTNKMKKKPEKKKNPKKNKKAKQKNQTNKKTKKKNKKNNCNFLCWSWHLSFVQE